MKRFLTIFIIFALSTVTVNQAIAENQIWFETSPVSAFTADKIPADVELTFSFFYNSDVNIWGGTGNDFIFYSPDGATWNPLVLNISQHLPTFFSFILSNGMNSDTIHVWANPIWDFDLNAGFSLPVFEVKTVITNESIGKSFCIDSLNSFHPDYDDLWFWGDIQGDPVWQGEQCFTIVDCCYDYKGDINFDGENNISDLVHLVDYMFRGGSNIPCQKQADFNPDGEIDITDLTTYIRYLFMGGPPAYCD